MDYTVHGIRQARRLEWVAFLPSPGDLPNTGIEPRSPALQADSLPPKPPGKPQIILGEWNNSPLYMLYNLIFILVKLIIDKLFLSIISSVQSLSRVRLFVIP